MSVGSGVASIDRVVAGDAVESQRAAAEDEADQLRALRERERQRAEARGKHGIREREVELIVGRNREPRAAEERTEGLRVVVHDVAARRRRDAQPEQACSIAPVGSATIATV